MGVLGEWAFSYEQGAPARVDGSVKSMVVGASTLNKENMFVRKGSSPGPPSQVNSFTKPIPESILRDCRISGVWNVYAELTRGVEGGPGLHPFLIHNTSIYLDIDRTAFPVQSENTAALLPRTFCLMLTGLSSAESYRETV